MTIRPRIFTLGLTMAGLAGALAGAPVPLLNTVTTTERLDHQRENRALVDLLQNLHYSDQQFRDVDSNDMIDAFVAKLDPDRMIFSEADLKRWHQRFGRTLKAVYLVRGDEQPMFEIADHFRATALGRCGRIEAKLDAGVDLSTPDTPLAHDLAPARDDAELDQRWEKQLKASLLRQRLLGRPEVEAAREVRKQYGDFRDEIDRLDANRVREIFWESQLGLFDPHSGYFAADTAEEFAVMMRAGVSGVGVSVGRRHGNLRITAVHPGGPADESGELEPGDELVALVDDDGARIEAAKLTVSEATARLRGPAGTKLQLFFRRTPDGPVRELTLPRRDLVLMHDRARGAVAKITTEQGEVPVGWIHLPDFYHDEHDGIVTSAAADVRELLTQMDAAGVQAVVLDLRADPGGAIIEAVALAGAFIPEGTVVITRGSDLKTKPQAVERNAAQTGKPLLILVSRESASASELFAGAMQYHRRAIVVGSERTFGKGTAQAYIDLNRLAFHPANAGRWGTLRVTAEKFYFPSGQSAQGAGARSDLVLPEGEADRDFKFEEQLPHALRAEKLEGPTPPRATGGFASVDEALLRQLRERSGARREHASDFQVATEEQAYLRQSNDAAEKTLRWAEAAAADAALLLAREKLRRDVLALPDVVQTRPVDIALVREAKEKHEAWARARKPTAASPTVGWVDRAIFRLQDGDTLREIPLAALPFRERVADAPLLAAAFSRASGRPKSADELGAALRALALLETYSEAEIARCFGAPEPTDAAVWRGIEAVLHELTVSEPTTYSRLKYDVTARETLRIAADWVQLSRPRPESGK